MIDFRQLFGRSGRLEAGWHVSDGLSVLWLRSGKRVLAVVESAVVSPSSLELAQESLRQLGANDVIALNASAGELTQLTVDDVGAALSSRLPAVARLARASASRARLSTSAFSMPVAGENLRTKRAASASWPAAAIHLQTRQGSILLCALPTCVLPAAVDAWRHRASSLFAVAHTMIFPCWIADLGPAEAFAPAALWQLADLQKVVKPSLSWQRLRVRTAAREVDSENLADALALTRQLQVPPIAPGRREFGAGSPEARAFAAAAELDAAARRGSRFLDVMHVNFGGLHFAILPGPPVEALARRLVERAARHLPIQLVTQCGGGGVLSAWALYRGCDYETQAAFQPHSIATGDYLVKACTELAARACHG